MAAGDALKLWFETVFPLDHHRHVRALPVGPDPAQALVLPAGIGPPPVTPHHEPRHDLSPGRRSLELPVLPYPRNIDFTREEEDVLVGVQLAGPGGTVFSPALFLLPGGFPGWRGGAEDNGFQVG